MNRDTLQVNKAIIKAVNKLALFSLTERVVLSGGLEVALMGNVNAIWVTTKCLNPSYDVKMINTPRTPTQIGKFNDDIKSFIDETNLKLNQK